jgi:DNA-binding CsgD family transcriptional regulator
MIFDVTGRTVEKHLESIYRKLGVHNRAAAVAHALECASSLSE